MKKAIKISFIMPVYRVEEYVKECIESILGCLREDDELLFVIRDFKDKSTLLSMPLFFLFYNNNKAHDNIRFFLSLIKPLL